MSPPIDIDGSEIQRATIDGEDVSEITIDGQQTAGFVDIPDSEGFEHNDLAGVYGGDTGSFNIQTSTVFEGSYALFGDGAGSNALIVRNGDPFDPKGLRLNFRQYN